MKQKKYILPIIFLITVALFYFLGYLHGHRNLIYYKGYQPQIINKELGKPKDLDFSLFWDVWNKVNEKYPGQVNQKKIFYGAISGILTGLEDPYSSFLEPGLSERFLEDLEGEFEGIGVEITLKDNQLTVVSTLDGSPAKKAGVEAEDVIIKIDDKEAVNIDLEKAVELIRGRRGTKVSLTILREGFEEPRDFVITREKIKVLSVKFEIKEGKIGYLKISQFGADTMDLLDKAVSEILKNDVKKVILDLRDNPGGYLDTAVQTASLFIKEGPIVFEEYKGGKMDSYDSTGDGRLENISLVVLTNSGSASGSEIVAGAIQDLDKGILIGEKTFGKGSVQEFEDLKAGASLRLTIAKWLTPKKRYINEKGVVPDIEVKMTKKDRDKGLDPQLDRAIKELKK